MDSDGDQEGTQDFTKAERDTVETKRHTVEVESMTCTRGEKCVCKSLLLPRTAIIAPSSDLTQRRTITFNTCEEVYIAQSQRNEILEWKPHQHDKETMHKNGAEDNQVCSKCCPAEYPTCKYKNPLCPFCKEEIDELDHGQNGTKWWKASLWVSGGTRTIKYVDKDFETNEAGIYNCPLCEKTIAESQADAEDFLTGVWIPQLDDKGEIVKRE
jgi:hypothetical protein